MVTRRQLFPLGVLLVGASTGLLGCSPSQEYGEAEPRSISDDEAERLAVARFNNYDSHRRNFSVSYAAADSTLWAEGRIDFQAHVGYAHFVAQGDPTDTYALLQWTPEALAAVGTQGTELPQQPPPDAPWEQRPLDASGSSLDAVLAVTLSLAADRPENPLLLQQNGAQWLGRDELEGVPVDAISGPSAEQGPSDSLIYFIDETGTMHRLVVNFPDGGTATINFLEGSAEEITTTIPEPEQ